MVKYKEIKLKGTEKLLYVVSTVCFIVFFYLTELMYVKPTLGSDGSSTEINAASEHRGSCRVVYDHQLNGRTTVNLKLRGITEEKFYLR